MSSLALDRGMADAPEKKKRDVPELLARLERALRDRPLLFQRVGGELALEIVGHEPSHFTVRAKGGVVEIVQEKCARPIATIGIKPAALEWLIEGTLDVERAFETHRLAVEGDKSALGRFAQCFTPSSSTIGVRSKK
jgi:hypothetical protein